MTLLSERRTRLARGLSLAAFGILIVGLTSALAIFIARAPGPTGTGEENVDGVAYPLKVSDDPRAQFEIERLGGKMGLLMVEFDEWIAGFWKGRTLSYTIAVMTVALAIGLRFVAQEIWRSLSH